MSACLIMMLGAWTPTGQDVAGKKLIAKPVAHDDHLGSQCSLSLSQPRLPLTPCHPSKAYGTMPPKGKLHCPGFLFDVGVEGGQGYKVTVSLLGNTVHGKKQRRSIVLFRQNEAALRCQWPMS